MSSTILLLVLSAANPEVTRAVAAIATNQGEARAHAVQSYVAGCRGKSRTSYRNNQTALEALRPTFTDEHEQVRAAALGLTVCYPAGTFAQEIVALTDDKDPNVRERA